MDYELNDQDRADLVKNFVKKFGPWIILAIVIIAIGFGINAYLNKRQAAENQNASNAYQAMITAAQNGATAQQITASANELIKNYPDTVYATFSQLTLANIDIQQGNLADAENLLKTALKENHKNTLEPVIQMRLARVYIAENKLNDAIALLKDPPKGFEAPFNLLTGDAELLQNNTAAAKASYLAAQQANNAQNDPLIAQLLTERLNSLGGNS